MSPCDSKGFPSTNLSVVDLALSILEGRSDDETHCKHETLG
jgi:hypothetical protein